MMNLILLGDRIRLSGCSISLFKVFPGPSISVHITGTPMMILIFVGDRISLSGCSMSLFKLL